MIAPTAHARERHNPLVLAVPRGGLIVADPIANALGLSLDVWVTGPGPTVRRSYPHKGTIQVPISPIRLHGSPPAGVDRVAPAVGEDTDRVLQDVLGLGSEELERAGLMPPAMG